MQAHMEMVGHKLWASAVLCCLLLGKVGADIAAPVEQCDATGCNLSNAYRTWPDRIPCKAALVVYPTTEEEIVHAVATAVKNKQKIKVSTKSSHSIPKLACPGTTNSTTGSGYGVTISTTHYASIVGFDIPAMTVTAQSGILMHDLIEAIGNQNLALPFTPYWNAVTLGGSLATASHGSSHFGKGGAVHEYVIGLRLVIPATEAEGFAKVVALTLDDGDLMNAAKVSLGVLGVVSTVTLQLQALFKRNLTLEVADTDVGLEDNIFQVADTVEFGDVTWFPSSHQVVYRIDQRASEGAAGDGVNRFFGFQPKLGVHIELARALEDSGELLMDRDAKCLLAKVNLVEQIVVGFGYEKVAGHGFQGFPVIGDQHRMQSSSGCERGTQPETYCPWDQRIRGLRFFENSAAIPMRNLREFISDIKSLRDAAHPLTFCGLDVYTGFLIRFVKASSGAFLGAQEDVAMVDFTYYRAADATTPRMDEDAFEEIEQIAFYKYGAKPHWGKNRNYVFHGVARNYRDIDKFLAVRALFDPEGFFSSEWSDEILGIASNPNLAFERTQPYCALEGLCVCSEDIHCAPEKGYYCRPGIVYSAAKVCRFEDTPHSQTSSKMSIAG